MFDTIYPWIFCAAAFACAFIALVWGDGRHAAGAGLLALSICTTIVVQDLFPLKESGIGYLALDAVMLSGFLVLGRHSLRWPKLIALTYAGTMCVELAALAGGVSGYPYAFALNTLTAAALLACIVAALPKSIGAARDVIRIKLFYLFGGSIWRAPLRGVTKFEGRRMEKTGSGGAFDRNAEINAHVGDQVRRARILCGLSRETLADAIGVSVPQLQKYETGKTRISARTLYDLSRLLRQNVNFFFEGLDDVVGADVEAICERSS